MKRIGRILVCAVLMVCCVLIAGCFPGTRPEVDPPAGFFMGVWHGWIAPISLVAGLFDDTIRIYEVHNVGWWYDLGFYMAVISGFGGIHLSRKRRRKKE